MSLLGARMKKLLLCCLILMAANVYAASKQKVGKITAEQVMQHIQTAGAQSTVARLKLAPNDRNWMAVCKQIEKGSDDWLAVAGELSRGLNDVTTSKDLRIALSNALTKNPAGVLRLANGNPIDILYVCSGTVANRHSALNTYVNKTIQALSKVNDPNLQQYVTQCATTLRQAVAIEKALRQKEVHKNQAPLPESEPSTEPENTTEPQPTPPPVPSK